MGAVRRQCEKDDAVLTTDFNGFDTLVAMVSIENQQDLHFRCGLCISNSVLQVADKLSSVHPATILVKKETSGRGIV